MLFLVLHMLYYLHRRSWISGSERRMREDIGNSMTNIATSCSIQLLIVIPVGSVFD